MIIKQKKPSFRVLLGIALFTLLCLLVLTNKDIRKQHGITGGNIIQKFMSLNLGFSSLKNLEDNGNENVEGFNTSKELISLMKSAPKIVKYNLFNYDSYDFDRVDIIIKFSDYLKINEDRQQAISDRILSNPTKVNAKLYHNGNEYKAKLRLKGDNLSHWFSTPRLSFRVRVKNGKTILGFNKFSLQKPEERQHPYDYVFQSMIRDIGNLSPVHKFVHLYVNGDDWGIMNMEEHMSKELLEKQNKKDSVIVRFSNEKSWLYKSLSKAPYKYYRLSDPSLYSHLYSKDKSIRNIQNRKIYTYILNSKIKGVSNIYDTDSFSKALILTIVWGNPHVLHDSNTKYYFNPYTLKLEVVSTDQHPWHLIDKTNKNEAIEEVIPSQYFDLVDTSLYADLLSNNLRQVKNVVSSIEEHLVYPQLIFPLDRKKSTRIIKDNMDTVNSDYKYYLIDSLKEIAKVKREKPKKVVLPTKQQSAEFQEHLYIRHYTDGTLELYNLLPDSVVVKNILFNGHLFANDDIVVPSYLSNPEPTIVNTPYLGVHDNMFTVNTLYQGEARTTNNDVTLVSDGIDNPLLRDTANKFDFINKVNDTVYKIKSGEWFVNNPIIIEGDLHISPNTNLKFSNNSYIIVKGALKAIGSDLAPITLESSESLWKGIYVFNAKNKSYLMNIYISDISALEDDLLRLTGGITFYKSDVDFENIKINNVKSEDAINIVESIFSLSYVSISDTVSDGIDSDFSNGNIIHSNFLNICGDAMDFSGSDVLINQTKARNVKDKSVSAGEKSILNIKNCEFNDIGVGVASKDGSSVIVHNTKISNYKLYAAMSYRKKDFYDMPGLSLKGCFVSDGDAYMRQIGSDMIVDNIKIPETNLSIKKLYKTRVMAK